LSIFYPGTVSSSTVFSLSLLLGFVLSCLFAMHLKDQEIRKLNERLSPKLKIRNLVRRKFPDERDPRGVEYYFEVFNQSEGTSLDNVCARLTSLSPDVLQYLPVPLHIKHDNPSIGQSFATQFSLAPLQGKHVDLLTGPIPNARRPILIEHTVVGVKAPIELRRFRMTVEATGKDTQPDKAYFEAWIDQTGSLKCIQL
jgi:hypothetical protein